MGASYTKKEPSTSEPTQQSSVSSFYVETELKDIPKRAKHEWNSLLRRNDMSMDQDNLDFATEKLKEGEKIFNDDREKFYEMKKW